MKKIPLRDKDGVIIDHALVDDEDYDFLMQWKWSRVKGHSTYYATRSSRINGKSKNVRMHRVILGILNSPEIQGDHKDFNGLNNQKGNLRKATHTENLRHKRKRAGGTSEYFGVSKVINKYRGKMGISVYESWRAVIRTNNKDISSYHRNEVDAAKAYDIMAKKHFGEFATLNFPTQALTPI